MGHPTPPPILLLKGLEQFRPKLPREATAPEMQGSSHRWHLRCRRCRRCRRLRHTRLMVTSRRYFHAI